MKKFLIQVSIFSIPILLCSPFIFLLEPFNFHIVSRIIDRNTNRTIINSTYKSYMLETDFYKLYQFKQDPCRNIIIGDSQGTLINEKLIKKLTGNEICNLSISGADPETKFSIFWFAAEQTKLNHVTFQLSFENWNIKANSFHYEQNYLNKPLLYLLSRAIIIDLHQKIVNNIGEYGEVKVPYTLKFPITEDKNKLFDTSLKDKYKNYIYSDKNIEELRKIVNYCKNNEVSIEFLIFPFYQRYFDYLSDHDLIRFYDQFISDISLLAKTQNYSSNKNFTNQEKNFTGYFHQNKSVTDSITSMVWKNNNLNQ